MKQQIKEHLRNKTYLFVFTNGEPDPEARETAFNSVATYAQQLHIEALRKMISRLEKRQKLFNFNKGPVNDASYSMLQFAINLLRQSIQEAEGELKQ